MIATLLITNQDDIMNKQKAYVGIVIGERRNFFCILDKDGNVLKRGTYPNTRKDAASLAKDLVTQYNPEVVCEHTANIWIKTYEEFERCGIPILVTNSGTDTDEMGAERLADRLILKDISAMHIRPSESRHTMNILHQRFALVADRVRVMNRQHAILEKYDYSEDENPSGAEYLNGLKLDSVDAVIMGQLVRQVTCINDAIDILDGLVDENAYRSEDALIIMSLPGFDYISSLMIAISIDGIERFAGPKQLASHLGVSPRVDRTAKGRMKGGKLRWIMMNCAMAAHSQDKHLGELYEKHSSRHPPPVARSHLANKMATYIYHMLTKRELYEFHDKDQYEAKVSKLKASRGS